MIHLSRSTPMIHRIYQVAKLFVKLSVSEFRETRMSVIGVYAQKSKKESRASDRLKDTCMRYCRPCCRRRRQRLAARATCRAGANRAVPLTADLTGTNWCLVGAVGLSLGYRYSSRTRTTKCTQKRLPGAFVLSISLIHCCGNVEILLPFGCIGLHALCACWLAAQPQSAGAWAGTGVPRRIFGWGALPLRYIGIVVRCITYIETQEAHHRKTN